MTDDIFDISSSKYIAPLHVSQEQEVGHALMQPVVYRNFYTDGEAAHPVFGLTLSEDYLNSLPKHYDWTIEVSACACDNELPNSPDHMGFSGHLSLLMKYSNLRKQPQKAVAYKTMRMVNAKILLKTILLFVAYSGLFQRSLCYYLGFLLHHSSFYASSRRTAS